MRFVWFLGLRHGRKREEQAGGQSAAWCRQRDEQIGKRDPRMAKASRYSHSGPPVRVPQFYGVGSLSRSSDVVNPFGVTPMSSHASAFGFWPEGNLALYTS